MSIKPLKLFVFFLVTEALTRCCVSVVAKLKIVACPALIITDDFLTINIAKPIKISYSNSSKFFLARKIILKNDYKMHYI